MKKVNIIIMILLLLKAGAYTQTMEVGIFAGGSYYLGDINPGVHFQQTRPAGGLIARYNIDTRWSVRASVLVGQVRASDLFSQAVDSRNLYFQTLITDISTVGEFNFFPFINGSSKNYMTPYIFGGASLFFFNPKRKGEKLREYGTEGQNISYENRSQYSTRGIAIPFGIGFKYSLTENIGLAFEWGMRKTFTDYIDDISTTYPVILVDNQASFRYDLSDPYRIYLTPEELERRPGQQRGDPKTMDWFNFVGISITVEFDIFNGSTCIDFTDGYR